MASNAGEHEIEAFAALAAELAMAADRSAVLAKHGLDESAYAALEDHWLEELARAESDDSVEGAPPLVLRFATAFARAQQRGNDLLPFDLYVEVTRALSRGHDLAAVLKRHDLELPTYLRAHQHWLAALLADPERSRLFRQLLGA